MVKTEKVVLLKHHEFELMKSIIFDVREALQIPGRCRLQTCPNLPQITALLSAGN